MLWNIENDKTNGILIEAGFENDITRINFETIRRSQLNFLLQRQSGELFRVCRSAKY